MGRADRSIVPCNGKLCFRVTATTAAEADHSHPCPFILARYGVKDPCRCCSHCEAACRKDIEDTHA